MQTDRCSSVKTGGLGSQETLHSSVKSNDLKTPESSGMSIQRPEAKAGVNLKELISEIFNLQVAALTKKFGCDCLVRSQLQPSSDNVNKGRCDKPQCTASLYDIQFQLECSVKKRDNVQSPSLHTRK
jgi:hypothetical protein